MTDLVLVLGDQLSPDLASLRQTAPGDWRLRKAFEGWQDCSM